MKIVIPFSVGSIVLTILFLWIGFAGGNVFELFNVHEIAREPFLWILFGIYAPLWVLLVNFLTRKMEYKTKMKAFLFGVGAIVFWVGLFLYNILLNGITSSEDTGTFFFVAIIVIAISLLSSFLFWGLVTLANRHKKQWIVVSIFSLLFNVYMAFVSNTIVKEWEVEERAGVKHVTFSYLTGEKDLSLGAIADKDYFMLLTYTPTEGQSGWHIYDLDEVSSTEIIELNEDEEYVIKVEGLPRELKVQLSGKEWRNGNVMIFHGEDFNKVVNDYRVYREKQMLQ